MRDEIQRAAQCGRTVGGCGARPRVLTVGPLSPRAYVEAVGIDRKTALTDLHGLAERGLIQAQGTTTDRRYTLPREDR
jgi:hypothetical protein